MCAHSSSVIASDGADFQPVITRYLADAEMCEIANSIAADFRGASASAVVCAAHLCALRRKTCELCR